MLLYFFPESFCLSLYLKKSSNASPSSLSFYIKPIIFFWQMFLQGRWYGMYFFLPYDRICFPQGHLLKKLSFNEYIWFFFPPRLGVCGSVVFFSRLLYSLDLHACSCGRTMLPWHRGSVVWVKIRYYDISRTSLSSQDCFCCPGSFMFPYAL